MNAAFNCGFSPLLDLRKELKIKAGSLDSQKIIMLLHYAMIHIPLHIFLHQ